MKDARATRGSAILCSFVGAVVIFGLFSRRFPARGSFTAHLDAVRTGAILLDHLEGGAMHALDRHFHHAPEIDGALAKSTGTTGRRALDHANVRAERSRGALTRR